MILSVDIGTALTKGLLYDGMKGPVSKIILPTDQRKDVYKTFINLLSHMQVEILSVKYLMMTAFRFLKK